MNEFSEYSEQSHSVPSPEPKKTAEQLVSRYFYQRLQYYEARLRSVSGTSAASFMQLETLPTSVKVSYLIQQLGMKFNPNAQKAVDSIEKEIEQCYQVIAEVKTGKFDLAKKALLKDLSTADAVQAGAYQLESFGSGVDQTQLNFIFSNASNLLLVISNN
jgi:hypothetical protein